MTTEYIECCFWGSELRSKLQVLRSNLGAVDIFIFPHLTSTGRLGGRGVIKAVDVSVGHFCTMQTQMHFHTFYVMCGA